MGRNPPNSGDIEQQVEALPVFPAVALQLDRLSRSEHTTTRQLSALVSSDAGLAANVLRLANSALFGLSGRVASVEQAVALLGVNRLRQLVFAGAFSKVLPARLDGYGLTDQTFWQHNAGVAVIAEELAKLTGCVVPQVAFTCGLLHDCGKLVLGPLLAKARAQDGGDHDWQSIDRDLERRVLGIDHAAAGGMVAYHWDLPEEIAAAAAYHHDPSALEKPLQSVAWLVHDANVMAHAIGLGGGLSSLSRDESPLSTRPPQGPNAHMYELVLATSLSRAVELGAVLDPQ